jgi:hypothetical protein
MTMKRAAQGDLIATITDGAAFVRLKKDIVDAREELPYLASMRLRDYTLGATGERRTGRSARRMETHQGNSRVEGRHRQPRRFPQSKEGHT